MGSKNNEPDLAGQIGLEAVLKADRFWDAYEISLQQEQ